MSSRLSMFSVALLAVRSLIAQPNPAELFPQQAEVFVDSAELTRLELPNEVLTQAAADLSDLRLFDAQGQEVPYSVERGLPGQRESETASYPLQVISVDRSTSVPERGQTRYREAYVLELDSDVRLQGQWQLRFEHTLQDFVRRVDVNALQPGGGRVALLQDASFFSLRSGLVSRKIFDLRTLPSRTIEVTIEGDGGTFITPQVSLLNSRLSQVVPREVPLTILRQTQDGPWTELEVERPRGLTLTALRFSTSTPTFLRDVEVLDRLTGSPDRRLELERTIFRIPAEPPVADLDMQVQPAVSDRLVVRILNQDSPPLADLAVTALAARPTLLFTMSPGESGAAAGTLRFGGGRVAPPRYDLAAIQGIFQSAGRALAQQARLGEINPNPEYSAAPLLAFASRPGATIDARAYSHMRPIQLTPSDEGLSRVELTVEDAAYCRPDFADIRLVDAGSAQWPYLLDQNARQEWLPLALTANEDADEGTEYLLDLPAQPARLDRLRLDFDNAFFDRPYQLLAVIDGAPERMIAAGRLSRAETSREPLTIEFAPIRATSLRLLVTDGNDRSLAGAKAEGRFPLPNLYTVAPAGGYRLLLGFPDDRPPVYELSRASSTVLAVRAGTATVGDVVENPLFSASSRLNTGPGSRKALFWIALLAAVGVLAVMTLKTVRADAGDPS